MLLGEVHAEAVGDLLAAPSDGGEEGAPAVNHDEAVGVVVGQEGGDVVEVEVVAAVVEGAGQGGERLKVQAQFLRLLVVIRSNLKNKTVFFASGVTFNRS